MQYLTQLIYIVEGEEAIFNEFESMAIPLIAKYGGSMPLRFRPGAVIAANMEVPYEVHFISLPSEEDFALFMADEERKAFLHLKQQSVRASMLISGKSA